MREYANTLTVGLGDGLYLHRPPRGKTAKAWNRMRAAYPYVDGSRVSEDTGRRLCIEIERTMGDAAFRRKAIADLAEALGTLPAKPYVAEGPPRVVTHWIALTRYGDVDVLVNSQICECHDGLAETTGVFDDIEDVAATAAGKALRDVVPPEQHDPLAEAEVIRDVELAMRKEP